MSDIQRLMDRIAVLNSEIEVRQHEKDELETAIRVIRRWSVGDTPDDGRHRRNRKRVTILDMARSILLDGQERYYADVADTAITQGYRGREGSKKDRIQKSFWATMKRNPEIFDAIGGGKFRLRKEKAQ
jgi:hypothetical protein